MIYNQFEIVLVPFPFTDKNSSKNWFLQKAHETQSFLDFQDAQSFKFLRSNHFRHSLPTSC